MWWSTEIFLITAWPCRYNSMIKKLYLTIIFHWARLWKLPNNCFLPGNSLAIWASGTSYRHSSSFSGTVHGPFHYADDQDIHWLCCTSLIITVHQHKHAITQNNNYFSVHFLLSGWGGGGAIAMAERQGERGGIQSTIMDILVCIKKFDWLIVILCHFSTPTVKAAKTFILTVRTTKKVSKV